MAEYPSYLIHYGVSGQKWGTRRYQNEDGSLTPEGKEHYGYGSERDNRKLLKQMTKAGKHTKVNEWGTHKKLSGRAYEKLSKNKAVQEAIKDEKLMKAQDKVFNTKRKYLEPDADAISDEILKKYLKKSGKNSVIDLDDIEYHKYLQEADKQIQKEYRKFRELDKKDPYTIAMKDLDNNISRVSKELASKYANVKIGDITYEKHIKDLVDYASTRKYADEYMNKIRRY